MASYICLNCGAFQTGDENRRMMNHCPECEQTISNTAIREDNSSLQDLDGALHPDPDESAAPTEKEKEKN